MSATAWTEADVRSVLEREDFAYQNIELPYGLSTGGRDRSASANKMFPEDLTGKSVLDVGCKYGYFCFEALRRGASRVVGLDLDQDSLRKARILADCLGADVRFDLCNIETDEIDEDFDYILCLNLLHHLRNPISALDKLIERTCERLVLEVATFGPHDAKKFGNLGALRWLTNPLPLLPILFQHTPVIVLGAGGKKPMAQQFFLSPPAVKSLLLDQRGSFASVETKPSEHKGRFIALAEKWRVDRMILIAGPTSAGKSTLIERLRGGELDDVAAALELEQPDQWSLTNALGLPSLAGPKVERLIYHYDFLRPFLRGPNEHRRDHALDILKSAGDLTSVTIWTPPERLSAQHQTGVIDRKTKNGRYRVKKRHLQIAEVYRQPDQVKQLYDNWFGFISGLPGRHLVLELGDRPELFELSDWQAKQGANRKDVKSAQG